MTINKDYGNLGVVIGNAIRSNLMDVHTQMNGFVTKVNGNLVDVKITWQIHYTDVLTYSYPELYDIPVLFPTGGKGLYGLTFPIAEGDEVVVYFGERNPHNQNDTTVHGLYPICAIPERDAAKDFDSNNVLLRYKDTHIKITPNDTIELKTNGTTMIIQGNKITATCQEADINGAKITQAGDVVTKNGNSLDNLTERYNSHTHAVSGVQGGGDTVNSNTPSN